MEAALARIRSGAATLGDAESLTRKSLGAEAAASIADALCSSACRLTRLDLSGNLLGPEGTHALVSSVISIQGGQKKISGEKKAEEIKREGTRLPFPLSPPMCGGVKHLASLVLADNALGPEGAQAISLALSSSTFPHLRLLGLWDNEIGDQGASAIASALCSSKNRTSSRFGLRSLNLGGNHIGDPGAVALAESLYENDTLTQLGLWDNLITFEGAAAIARALRCENPNTTSYSSSSSTRSDSGNRFERGPFPGALAPKRERPFSALRILFLWDNYGVGDQGALEFALTITSERSSLAELWLPDAGVGPAGSDALESAVGKRRGVRVPLTAGQRLAFLMGHLGPKKRGESTKIQGGDGIITNNVQEREKKGSPVRKLGLDLVKRILLGYPVEQGRRWFHQAETRMMTKVEVGPSK